MKRFTMLIFTVNATRPTRSRRLQRRGQPHRIGGGRRQRAMARTATTKTRAVSPWSRPTRTTKYDYGYARCSEGEYTGSYDFNADGLANGWNTTHAHVYGDSAAVVHFYRSYFGHIGKKTSAPLPVSGTLTNLRPSKSP